MRYVSLPRPSTRGVSRVAAVTAVAVAAGVTAGSAPAVTQQPASLQLAYACAFPAGSRPVSAQITASFPAATKVGQPIRPTGTGITVTLPQAAVVALAGLQTSTVTLTAGLSTRVSEGPRSATLFWRGFTSPAMAIPRTGPLRVTTSGAAPGVLGAVAGQVTFTAGALSLLFTAGQAAGPSGPSSGPGGVSSGPGGPSAGSASPSTGPTRPAGIRVTCAPRTGQDAALARITVTGPTAARAPVSGAANPALCVPFPKGLKLNPLFPLPNPPPGIPNRPSVVKVCSYATGLTTLRRLHEAALVGPGLTDLKLAVKQYVRFPPPYFYFQQDVAGQLQYHGRPELPPARATLLAFGFTPVTATQQITEIGSVNATLITCVPGPKKCPNHPVSFALFFARVMLRIYDVKVDGVPLNVGPHCQTAPFTLKLEGTPPSYSVLAIQGTLTGMVTVPAFTGCGVGENLDPIFNASVSGPGNFVTIEQALNCTPAVGLGCPPGKPIGAASLLLKDGATGKTFTCTSLINGTFSPGSSQNPVGTITSAAISCPPQLGLNFTVSPSAQTSPWPINAAARSGGAISGTITNVGATINSIRCNATLAGTSATTPGSVNFTYANGTQLLKISGGNLHYWNASGCKGVINTGDPVELTATYPALPAAP